MKKKWFIPRVITMSNNTIATGAGTGNPEYCPTPIGSTCYKTISVKNCLYTTTTTTAMGKTMKNCLSYGTTPTPSFYTCPGAGCS